MKVYVEVIASFDVNGEVNPLSLKWEDGRIYEIDKILDVRPTASLKGGGAGTRYLVRINGQERYLFCEGQNVMNRHSFCRWFIEK